MPAVKASGLLGDTPARDYAHKLALFNEFAAPEIRDVIHNLRLLPGMAVLDAGCGTGHALGWLQEAVAPSGLVIGMDLASAHTATARQLADRHVSVLQAQLLHPPLRSASFDLVWCANTIHHLRDPLAGAMALKGLLRTGGRLVLAQSALVPELVFAWDAGLERRVADAVRRYYQHRYALEDNDLSAVRNIVGLARRTQLHNIKVHTLMIERISPLSPLDHSYLLDAIFRGTWGERLRPYLAGDDFAELERLCDPSHCAFALSRPDFHFAQSLTIVAGTS